MKVMLDTDVVLDVLTRRAPHAADSTELFSKIEDDEVVGLISAHSVTTLYYMAARHVGDTEARAMLRDVLSAVWVAEVNHECLQAALDLDFKDYEDAVVHESARQAGVDAIVTRNLVDYRNATLPVYSPAAVLKLLDQF